MGLDAVELVLACEDEFGIAIPDEAAGRISTPGMLTDYIYTRLRTAESPLCQSQRGFYRVRQVLLESFDAKRAELRPDSTIEKFLVGDIKELWRQLSEALGGASLMPLEINPKIRVTLFWLLPVLLAVTLYLLNLSLPLSGVVGVIYMVIASTIALYFRDTIPEQYRHLKDLIPHVGSLNEKLWQRDEVLTRVMEMTSEQSGMPLDKFSESSHFIHDIGLD